MNVLKRKTWHRLIFAFVFAGFVASCETDIDINTDNQDVPIVYCVLNSADSFQYVKLQKTYLVDKVASETPPDQDDMYFDGDILITLEHLVSGVVTETFTFQRTDDIVKDSGFFPTEKNILYKAKMKPVPNNTYRLYVYINNKETVLYSEVTTMGELTVIDPLPIPARKISLYPGNNYVCQWNPVENAGLYQVSIVINYEETVDGVTKLKKIDWPQTLYNPESDFDYLSSSISGTRFMHVLDENITPQAGAVRKVTGIDFQIVSGSLEMTYYVESTSASEGALMEKPSYTNITNGLGLFASVSRVNINDLLLSSVTLDSIAYGQFTHDLGFLDHNNDRDSTNNY